MQIREPREWILAAAGVVVPAVAIGWVAIRLGRGLSAPSGRALLLRRALLAAGAVAAYPLVMFVFVSFFIKPYFGSVTKMRAVACHANLKRLSTALALYAEDWDGTYPPADGWGNRIAPYLPSQEREFAYRCRSARAPYGYALNRAVAGRATREMADPETVVLSEHDSHTRNETVEPGTPLPTDRHGLPMVARMDGSVRSVMPSAEASLVWDSRVAAKELDSAE